MQAPNNLRLKVGAGRLGGLDPSAIAKAEAALKNLAGNFAQWLNDEIAKLEAARQALVQEGPNAHSTSAVYMRAHDLKGLGATYGFPLITRMAASLCMLLDDPEKRDRAPVALVEAHVEAIRTAVRDDLKTDEQPAGRALAEDLEARVAAALA
jgi:hypothetical protein